MPTTTYSEDEYLALLNDKHELERKVAALESLRPMWAQGFTSDSQAAQTWCSATKQLWEILDVCSQTDAVQKLRKVVWAPVPGPDPSRPLDIQIPELPEEPVWHPPRDPNYGPWVSYHSGGVRPHSDCVVQVLLASEQDAKTFSPSEFRVDQWDWTNSSDIVAYRVKLPRGAR